MSARKSGRTGRARHRAVRNARKPRPVPMVLDLALWLRALDKAQAMTAAPTAGRAAADGSE